MAYKMLGTSSRILFMVCFFQVSGSLDSSNMEIGSKTKEAETFHEPIVSRHAGGGSKQDSPSILVADEDDEMGGMGTSDSLEENIIDESERVWKRAIPPPGLGQRIYEIDPMLNSYRSHLDYR